MKILSAFLLLSLFVFFSCKKKNSSGLSSGSETVMERLPYDTTAIDSFAPGYLPQAPVEKIAKDSASIKEVSTN